MSEQFPTLRQRLHRKWWLFACLVIIVVVVGTIWWLTRPREPVLIPPGIVKQVTFPIYYPLHLPDGYSITATTFDEGVLLIKVLPPGGQNIFISEQAVPANLDYSKFLAKQLTRSSDVPNTYGQATIGQNQTTRIASLMTSHTWVLLNADKVQVNDSQFKAVLQALGPINP